MVYYTQRVSNMILSRDGRNYLPGHSAQYCTYMLVDMQAILQMNVLDVGEVAGKSDNMERMGFERGIADILAPFSEATDLTQGTESV